MSLGLYVDHLVPTIRSRTWPYDRGCHLFHIGGDLGALDRFAATLGLKRSWRHDAPRFIHYDLTAHKREQAIAAGIPVIDWRSPEGRAFLISRRPAAPGEIRP